MVGRRRGVVGCVRSIVNALAVESCTNTTSFCHQTNYPKSQKNQRQQNSKKKTTRLKKKKKQKKMLHLMMTRSIDVQK